jgi:signal transduction histidine kinase
VLFSVHNPGLIPRDAQRQVFRRYFSTKGADRGLGTYGMKLLGEEYLGGSVRFVSTEPEGTVFSLRLPLHPSGLGVEGPS